MSGKSFTKQPTENLSDVEPLDITGGVSIPIESIMRLRPHNGDVYIVEMDSSRDDYDFELISNTLKRFSKMMGNVLFAIVEKGQMTFHRLKELPLETTEVIDAEESQES